MSHATTTKKGKGKESASRPQGGAAKPAPTGRVVRETVESIVVAFILAFLFRTFEAEAFVIPTGSMAPTLQGRHKDFTCTMCGYQYRTSASEEVLDEEDELRVLRMRQRVNIADRKVVATTCPMCRYQDTSAAEKPSYNGDRILVAKFPFDFSEPRRWDVIVFKYPGDAKTNYIKRLVGLPKESVQIYHGDIYIAGSVDDARRGVLGRIQRKPPDKLDAMLQLVHDNKYFPKQLQDAQWPECWQAEPDSTWKTGRNDDSQWFESVEGSEAVSWIRYQHLLPAWRDWQNILRGARGAELASTAVPRLITDFYAYNTNVNRETFAHTRGEPEFQRTGLHWVGDLAVECDVELRGSSGAVLLELNEGAARYTCRIDVATGQAALSIEGAAGFAPTATTPVRRPARHRLRFANVDDQLMLWVDGRPVAFDADTTFNAQALGLRNDLPSRADVERPARIGLQGLPARIDRIKVWRDIYYITGDRPYRHAGLITDYDYGALAQGALTSHLVGQVMARPWEFIPLFESAMLQTYELENDQFFVLGDNSPYSKDSRLWHTDGFGHSVDRSLLIGKALFVYWPHSEHKIPGTNIPFPFFPNFRRMGFTR